MAIEKPEIKKYTIRQVAKISGLPESTLRYYESIGIIAPIARDVQTKRRTYSDEDLDLIVAIACLNATGMSIDDMKAYLDNFQHGEAGAFSQVSILSRQLTNLEEESRLIGLRSCYVKAKIDFWKAVIRRDTARIDDLRSQISAIADQLNLPHAPGQDAKGQKIQ